MGSSSRTKSAHPIHRLRAKKSIPRSPNPLFPFPSSSQPKILFRNSNSKLKIPPRYALSRAALRASVLRSTETHSMEQPKPETDPESQVPNGDSAAAKGSGSGSESQRTASSSGSIKKSVHWSPELVTESTFTSSPQGSRSNAYFSYSSSSSSSISQPTSTFNVMETVMTVRNVLGRWGRKVGEASRKAENLAGNTWQHLKTSPSIAEAAMGRIAQGTKVLAEGGYEKIFLSTFETVPEERLQNSFACYLSTSAGPVMGVLYLSTAKIAYSSDNPISYKSDNKTEWSYYKVVIPLHEIKAVNPSSNTANPSEKYIQVISVDNHEFWFMGFLNYDSAVDCLQDALQAGKLLQSEA